MSSEILHLSADDLMAPLPEDPHPRLGGTGPFVINLISSASPIDIPDAAATVDQPRYYQIQRTEDRRVRYRLRLGPYATEEAAVAALGAARQSYPTALTARAESEDVRAIAAAIAKANSRTGMQRTLAQPAASSQSTTPAMAGAPAKTAAPPQAARAAAPARAAATSPAARTPLPPLPPGALAAKPAPAAAKSASPRGKAAVPVLELAVEDKAAAPQWYAVDVERSDKPIDPEKVPQLDIFSLYRLYSIAGLDPARGYTLRLGFFSDEAAATAVAHYLREYFEKPAVTRVSVAERERFAVQKPKAGTAGASPTAAVPASKGASAAAHGASTGANGAPAAARSATAGSSQPAAKKPAGKPQPKSGAFRSLLRFR